MTKVDPTERDKPWAERSMVGKRASWNMHFTAGERVAVLTTTRAYLVGVVIEKTGSGGLVLDDFGMGSKVSRNGAVVEAARLESPGLIMREQIVAVMPWHGKLVDEVKEPEASPMGTARGNPEAIKRMLASQGIKLVDLGGKGGEAPSAPGADGDKAPPPDGAAK